MTAMRTEKDLLGELEVPADAYYGIHTQRALDNFKISSGKLQDHPELIRGLVQVKKACALANLETRILRKDIADAIVKACDLILDEGKCMDQFPEDVFQGGAGTSTNMNANEVIANLALETMGYERGRYDIINPNDHVNKSQSTNDAYPSGFRIAVYTEVQKLREALTGLEASFNAKADEFANVLKMGRTQLQDAVPMTVGQEFRAFAVLMREENKYLDMVDQFLLEVNLGATAIGTGLNTPPGYVDAVIRHLAEITGLEVTSAENLIEATSDTGAYVSTHAAVKRTAMKLGMICNDLRLLSSGPRAGLNEINLPERQAGSSIMPAKVNPVIPEVVNQVCFKVMGNDVTITMAAEAGQLQLNVMEPVIAQCLFESIDLMINGINTLRELCIDGITVNEEVCLGYVMNSIGIVTYLNERIGHAAGDAIGKECAKSGRSVREVVLEMGLLDEKELDEILSPENLMNPVYQGEYYSTTDPDVVPIEN